MKINHSSPWKDYLLWKRDILKEFFLQEEPNSTMSPLSKTANLSFHSIQHPVFKEVYPLFYSSEKKKRKRRITWKSLANIDEIGLLVWYLDDGSLAKDKREPLKGKAIYLYTDAYSLGEQQIMKKWFWKRFKVEAKIQQDTTHNIYFLRFNRKETLTLLSIFQNFLSIIPPSMHYKLDR